MVLEFFCKLLLNRMESLDEYLRDEQAGLGEVVEAMTRFFVIMHLLQ